MVDFEKGAAAANEPDPDEWGRMKDEAERLAEERRRVANGNGTMAGVSDKAK